MSDPSNVISLSVSGGLPGMLHLELQRWGQVPAATAVDHWVNFSRSELAENPLLLVELVPPAILRELRQWTLDDTAPGILAIVSPQSDLDRIPWELLPRVCSLPSVLVVRTLEQPRAPMPEARSGVPHILAAGWSGKPWLVLPGIQQELNALSQIGAASDVRWRVLSEPLPSELADAFGETSPLILHLIPPVVRNETGSPEILLSGSDEPRWLDLSELLASLPAGRPPELVVLNACHTGIAESGQSAARVVTSTLGSTTIGWFGPVDDLGAVDFALFFYNRLFEGMGVVEAVRSYLALQLTKDSSARLTRGVLPSSHRHATDGMLVLWTSSLAELLDPAAMGLRRAVGAEHRDARAATTTLERSAAPRRVDTPQAATRPAPRDVASSRVEIVFEPQKWLNPALLLNGRPAITQLTLKQDRPLGNVSVVVTCDTGDGSSAVRQMLDLQRGHHPIAVDGLEFPVLYELIRKEVPRRRINFTVTCARDGVLLAESTTSALWMGRAEWLDRPDTWHFVPAFVQPYSEGVLDVLDKAIPILKTLESPSSAFSGYQAQAAAYVDTQVEAVFNSLRSDFNLNYIDVPALPVYTGDQASSGQRVRWPADVIQRRRGTCHDLAILVASCLEHVGIHPLVILVRGHTFVAYWRDAAIHHAFWEAARNDFKRQAQGPGRTWTITDADEFLRLVEEGVVNCLEATWVANRNATFVGAIDEGKSHFDEPGRFDVAIDVRASRRMIQPL